MGELSHREIATGPSRLLESHDDSIFWAWVCGNASLEEAEAGGLLKVRGQTGVRNEL